MYNYIVSSIVYICSYAHMYTYVHVCTYIHCTNHTHLGVVVASPSNQQLLDQLPVERERGITVKAQTATMFYNKIGTDKQTHMLNLIDTPVRLICHLSLISSSSFFFVSFSFSPSPTTTFSLNYLNSLSLTLSFSDCYIFVSSSSLPS